MGELCFVARHDVIVSLWGASLWMAPVVGLDALLCFRKRGGGVMRQFAKLGPGPGSQRQRLYSFL